MIRHPEVSRVPGSRLAARAVAGIWDYGNAPFAAVTQDGGLGLYTGNKNLVDHRIQKASWIAGKAHLLWNKKSPSRQSISKGCTQLSWPPLPPVRHEPVVRRHVATAGLLAFGSLYLPRLPIRLVPESGCAAFVPDYSGGTAPDFNGIPYSAPKGTVDGERTYKKEGARSRKE